MRRHKSEMYQALRGIVCRLPVAEREQEDLLQEAVVHFWNCHQEIPGQSRSWYLQHCDYFLRNLLRTGRSVDSYKRQSGRISLPLEETPEMEQALPAHPESNASVLEDVSARDLMQELEGRLSLFHQEILAYAVSGFSAREIASRLRVSHTHVNKERQKIAATAASLGIVSNISRVR